MPFTLRGVSGQIHVSLVVNDDPLRYGCDLLDPDLPPDAAQGYPVCRAEIEHDADGYAAAMGWVQLVRSTDAAPEFEMDPLALFREVATPFAFFGIKPTMFDAPFRDEKYDLTWRAETFLCAIPDGVMSQHAQPLAGFGWGLRRARPWHRSGRAYGVGPFGVGSAPLGPALALSHVGVRRCRGSLTPSCAGHDQPAGQSWRVEPRMARAGHRQTR